MKRSGTLATVLAVLLLAATPAFSQVIGAGNMDGRMVDATGAVLPGVTVTVQNLDTGLTRTAITESSGRFTFLSLPVGPYTLTAELSGFQTLKREGLVMTVGAIQSLGNMTIEVATVEEIITVTAESPLIETSRAVVATTFNERAIDNLPIQGRDYKNFALNTPNVVPVANSGRRTISMGGMKGLDTNITVDGADFNNTFFGSATGQPEVPYFVISQEAVQEFQVLANGFSAEFGRSGGGFLNVVTKSGTNEAHGSGFFFSRGDWGRGTLQDGNGDDLDNSAFSQQQFGGSIGGPIVQDKAHFFFAVDRQGFDRPVRIAFNRDVSGVCNSAIWGRPIAGVDCLSDEEGDTAEMLTNTAILAKVDMQLSQNNTLSLRYNFSDFKGENFFSTAGGTAGSVQSLAENGTNLEANRAHSFVATNTTVIGTNKFNELRFQYSFEDRPRLGQSDDLPTTVINDTGRFGRQWFLPITSNHSRIQITDNFTYLFGDHDLKMGADLNITDTAQAFYGWGGGYYVFATLEDFVDQNHFQFTQRVGLNGFSTPGSGTIDIGQKEMALYVQDTWRPKPGLTIDLGLRWEGQWNPQAPVMDQGLQSLNPANPGLDTIGLVQGDIPNDLNNIAPRFGFAWDPENDGRTVVRGGAGIFYSRTNLLLMANSFTANGYRQALFFLFGDDQPFTYPGTFPEAGLPPGDPLYDNLPRSDIAFFDNAFNNPRTTRFNLGVEHEVRPNLSLGADFVFADTKNGHRRTNENLLPPIGTDAFGRGLYDRSTIDGDYNQFQVEGSTARRRYTSFVLSARKRFADDFQFQAFYTWSDLMTDDDNERDSSGFRNTQPESLGADWALSEMHVRHRFVANAVFDLPADFIFSTLITAQSGSPFNVTSGNDDNNDGNRNDYAVIDDSNRALAQSGGQDLADGLQGRNSGSQPSTFVMDIRFSKAFAFGGAGRIEGLFEVFNLFNTANRSSTNGSIGSPNFGFLNIVNAPRQIQIGVRYTF